MARLMPMTIVTLGSDPLVVNERLRILFLHIIPDVYNI